MGQRKGTSSSGGRKNLRRAQAGGARDSVELIGGGGSYQKANLISRKTTKRGREKRFSCVRGEEKQGEQEQQKNTEYKAWKG